LKNTKTDNGEDKSNSPKVYEWILLGIFSGVISGAISYFAFREFGSRGLIAWIFCWIIFMRNLRDYSRYLAVLITITLTLRGGDILNIQKSLPDVPPPPIIYDAALINLDGGIAYNTPSSADNIIAALRKALAQSTTSGLILHLNSSGGSQVQSSEIYNEITRLRIKYPAVPVYAVIGDVCTSECYHIAAAVDYIYANSASLIGSIGVTKNVSDTRNRINKSKPEQQSVNNKHAQQVQQNIQQQLIEDVLRGRGKRLRNPDKIFSGLSWAGEQAVELGLVDGLGSTSYIADEVIGARNIVNYSFTENQPVKIKSDK